MLRAPALLLVFLAPATQMSSNLQGRRMSVITQTGLSAVITCDIISQDRYIHWYRFQEGMAPRRILYYDSSNANVVVDSGIIPGKYYAYEDEGKSYKFVIGNLQGSDSGLYYCAVWESHRDAGLPHTALKSCLRLPRAAVCTAQTHSCLTSCPDCTVL
ncbi:hypothetical protein MC885_012208 [Smutsia gigantea]|nr:hypothetical protein MC885_012208 [Smutsia gigantea]